MITPNEIAARAKQREDENYAFRTYLKGHADPEELDAQFLELHNELFADYDCNSCRNCCKEYRGNLSDKDIMKCAEKFNMPLMISRHSISIKIRKDHTIPIINPAIFFRKTEVAFLEIANLSIAPNFRIRQDQIAGQVCSES